MGWFDEQIKQRIQNDDDMLANAFAQMANLVSSDKILNSFATNRALAEAAIGEILSYYHVKPQEIPDNLTELNDILEFLLRPSGIMRRTVKLSEGWYQDAVGAMLGTTTDGKIVALLPDKLYGYSYTDSTTGEVIRINRKTAGRIEADAVCFLSPVPAARAQDRRSAALYFPASCTPATTL